MKNFKTLCWFPILRFVLVCGIGESGEESLRDLSPLLWAPFKLD